MAGTVGGAHMFFNLSYWQTFCHCLEISPSCSSVKKFKHVIQVCRDLSKDIVCTNYKWNVRMSSKSTSKNYI